MRTMQSGGSNMSNIESDEEQGGSKGSRQGARKGRYNTSNGGANKPSESGSGIRYYLRRASVEALPRLRQLPFTNQGLPEDTSTSEQNRRGGRRRSLMEGIYDGAKDVAAILRVSAIRVGEGDLGRQGGWSFAEDLFLERSLLTSLVRKEGRCGRLAG